MKTRGIGTNIFRNVAPATVIIAAEEGMGSGFLINYDGLIVTNYHVIQKGVDSFSSDIKLVFCPVDLNNLQNSIVFQGRVLKIDRTRDLALIQMNSPVNKKISKIVRIDPNKSSVQVGMDVHAIGHPEGEYCTYTKGVVSQMRESYDWSYSENSLHQATVIQTQTPINPGNSGGPLINDLGKIIGINTFKHSEAVGINFAVSANDIQDFILYGPVPELKPETDECSEQVINADDINENGVNDFFTYDRDCNGIEDTAEYDENEDGITDYIILDTDENGTPDIRISFGIHDEGEFKGEEFARWEIDEDENGEFEEMCFDIDMDSEIDQCRSLI